MDDATRQRRIDDYLASMQGLIDEYGVAIQGVGGDEDSPQFAYTVGLGAVPAPEFIIFGLPMEIAQDLLNDLAISVLREQRTYDHGDIVHDLVEGYPVRMVRVADSSEDLTLANLFYGDPDRAPIAALQVVFPDAENRWPWEPGSGVANTPLLGEVPGDDDGTEQRMPSGS